MPQFDDHVSQAKRNLKHLQFLLDNCAEFTDWQVTVCFYTAVHLVNCHLAKFDMHYGSHQRVDDAINPYKRLSLSKLPEDIYLAYEKLHNLSRRSRYLINTTESDYINGHFTSVKHLQKALNNLNILLEYFDSMYAIGFVPIVVKRDIKVATALRYVKQQTT